MSPSKGGRNTSPKLKQNSVSYQPNASFNPQQANCNKISIELGGKKKSQNTPEIKAANPQAIKQA